MNPELSKALESAPAGYLLVDDQGVVILANLVARRWQLEVGRRLAAFLPELDQQKLVQFMTEQSDHARGNANSLQFETSINNPSLSKTCRLTVVRENSPTDNNLSVWLEDLSYQHALSKQISQMRRPLARQIKQINNLAVTVLGYTELVEIMLTETFAATHSREVSRPDITSRAKGETIIQYHREIVTMVRQIEALTVEGDRGALAGSKPGVLVVDQQAELTQLISELLSTAGYKVVSFNQVETALQYCRISSEHIQIALIDDLLTAAPETSLVRYLAAHYGQMNIIRLSQTAEESDKNHPTVSKPIDFNELLSVIASVVSDAVARDADET